MKRLLLAAITAALALFPSHQADQTRPDPSAGSQAVSGHERGPARGTVVVWNHYQSGKPTAHLRGTLKDGYGKTFGQVVARLEDHGGVTGYALTDFGYYSLRGYWDFDRYDERGWFAIRFDYGDSREVELVGNFEGWRDYWKGDWQLGYRD